MYTKTLYAAWADIDANGHMRNTGYLDKASDVRQMFLNEHGFPVSAFVSLRFSPVVMRDEIEYYREIGLLQEITITSALAGISPDGSRFRLRHDYFRPDGTPSARVTSTMGWLNRVERKLMVPPPALMSAVDG